MQTELLILIHHTKRCEYEYNITWHHFVEVEPVNNMLSNIRTVFDMGLF